MALPGVRLRARYTTRVGASKLASPAKGRGMRGFKRIIVMTTVAATALIGPAVGITGAQAAAPPFPYANGFENASDVGTYPPADNNVFTDVTRVPSGTAGITAS